MILVFRKRDARVYLLLVFCLGMLFFLLQVNSGQSHPNFSINKNTNQENESVGKRMRTAVHFRDHLVQPQMPSNLLT